MLTKTACLSFLLLAAGSLQSQTKPAQTIYFDFNEYSLKGNELLKLDSLVPMQKSVAGNLKLAIHGHCDSTGSDSYNMELSRKRAVAVKKYLVAAGILPKNIVEVIGYGKRNPLNENSTEEDRQLNRRVEIMEITGHENIKDVSLKEKISDSTTRAGTNIILRNINFVGGRALFLTEAQPMLNELLEAMHSRPTLVIRVEGHICCDTLASDGMDGGTGLINLSEARAKAVMDYLIANGIAADRVSYKGFGHANPIFPYPEKTEEERIANRRVEIKIIKK
jgi:outer membrane protein OmpA-like peptidoglycan-associated protein